MPWGIILGLAWWEVLQWVVLQWEVLQCGSVRGGHLAAVPAAVRWVSGCQPCSPAGAAGPTAPGAGGRGQALGNAACGTLRGPPWVRWVGCQAALHCFVAALLRSSGGHGTCRSSLALAMQPAGPPPPWDGGAHTVYAIAWQARSRSVCCRAARPAPSAPGRHLPHLGGSDSAGTAARLVGGAVRCHAHKRLVLG